MWKAEAGGLGSWSHALRLEQAEVGRRCSFLGGALARGAGRRRRQRQRHRQHEPHPCPAATHASKGGAFSAAR